MKKNDIIWSRAECNIIFQSVIWVLNVVFLWDSKKSHSILSALISQYNLYHNNKNINWMEILFSKLWNYKWCQACICKIHFNKTLKNTLIIASKDPNYQQPNRLHRHFTNIIHIIINFIVLSCDPNWSINFQKT